MLKSFISKIEIKEENDYVLIRHDYDNKLDIIRSIETLSSDLMYAICAYVSSYPFDEEREMELSAEDEDGVTDYTLYAMIELDDDAYLVFADIDEEAETMEILFARCIEEADGSVSIDVIDGDEEPEVFATLQEVFEDMMGEQED